MRQVFILLLMFLVSALVACQNQRETPKPASVLAEKDSYDTMGVDGALYTQQWAFSTWSDGHFMIGRTQPVFCTTFGFWQDQNRGSTSGTIVLNIDLSGCSDYPAHSTVSRQYTYSNGVLVLR